MGLDMKKTQAGFYHGMVPKHRAGNMPYSSQALLNVTSPTIKPPWMVHSQKVLERRALGTWVTSWTYQTRDGSRLG